MKFDQLATKKIKYFAIVSLCIVGLIVVVCSCAPRYVWRSSSVKTATNNFFVADIFPHCSYGCRSFSLTIENKTDKDIELDWNKTLYISNGTTSGGFMFEGVVYRDRNNPKPPDIIFANSKFSKTIWPNNLVDFTSGKYGGWEHGNMPTGENGVYLTVKVGGEEIKEKILTNIIHERVQK